jgi:chromosome segregation ATPase
MTLSNISSPAPVSALNILDTLQGIQSYVLTLEKSLLNTKEQLDDTRTILALRAQIERITEELDETNDARSSLEETVNALRADNRRLLTEIEAQKAVIVDQKKRQENFELIDKEHTEQTISFYRIVTRKTICNLRHEVAKLHAEKGVDERNAAGYRRVIVDLQNIIATMRGTAKELGKV